MVTENTNRKTTGLLEKYEEVCRLLKETPYMPITKACEAAGMTRSMYYLYRNENGGDSDKSTPKTPVAPISDDAPTQRTTQEQFEAKPSKTGS